MKISICMATYNGEKYIKRQLDSILKQLSLEDEIVIVDDCSKDMTVDLIRQYNDFRIKLVCNGSNQGYVKTFGRALSLASGEIIFLADQDDEWQANKVTSVLKQLCSNNMDLVCHDAIVVDGEGGVIHNSHFSLINPRSGAISNIIKGSFFGCCMAFRRSILKDVLPIPYGANSHDQYIGVMAYIKGYRVCFLDEKLIQWIRHGNNETPKKRRNMLQIIWDRIQLTIAILLSFFPLRR